MHIRKPKPDELLSLPKLALSTLAAVAMGAAIITTVVLPAELGIDPTGIGERLHLTRMGLLKTAMAEADAPLEGRPQMQDEMVFDLPAGQGQEIKMEMNKGFEARYTWSVEGGPVYHDTHGDIYNNEDVFVSYSKAESVTEDTGTIEAPYGGHHGWYWVNHGESPVTITLKTEGEYLHIMAK